MKNKSKPAEEDLVGKTIKSIEYIGIGPDGNSEGYGDLKITFTDGTSVMVCYSCMGGVYVNLSGLEKKKKGNA